MHSAGRGGDRAGRRLRALPGASVGLSTSGPSLGVLFSVTDSPPLQLVSVAVGLLPPSSVYQQAFC